jgi:hypothetical protein
MGILDRFRKKEETSSTPQQIKTEMTDLEKICGEDKEVYRALYNTMFLDPRKIKVSMEEAASNAKRCEKEKDFVSARTWYHIAGGLAIYEGNVAKVKEFYSSAEKVSEGSPNPVKYSILKDPEKAVKKAQEYYSMYLKD